MHMPDDDDMLMVRQLCKTAQEDAEAVTAASKRFRLSTPPTLELTRLVEPEQKTSYAEPPSANSSSLGLSMRPSSSKLSSSYRISSKSSVESSPSPSLPPHLSVPTSTGHTPSFRERKFADKSVVLTSTEIPISAEKIVARFKNPYQLTKQEINQIIERYTEKASDDRFHCQWKDCDDNGGRGWKAKGKLKPHIESDHLDLRILCPICDQEIKTRKDNLREHVEKSHADKFTTYECPELSTNGRPCGKKAKRASDLRRHLWAASKI